MPKLGLGPTNLYSRFVWHEHLRGHEEERGGGIGKKNRKKLSLINSDKKQFVGWVHTRIHARIFAKQRERQHSPRVGERERAKKSVADSEALSIAAMLLSDPAPPGVAESSDPKFNIANEIKRVKQGRNFKKHVWSRTLPCFELRIYHSTAAAEAGKYPDASTKISFGIMGMQPYRGRVLSPQFDEHLNRVPCDGRKLNMSFWLPLLIIFGIRYKVLGHLPFSQDEY